MNPLFSSLKRAGVMAAALMTLGAAFTLKAQVVNSGAGRSGVTNLSAQTAAPMPPAALSKGAVTQTPGSGNAALTPPATNRVGDSITHLLSLQADGQYASRNAYPVTSDVAQRTYQRYLESFTHKIPESAETQVGHKSGGSR